MQLKGFAITALGWFFIVTSVHAQGQSMPWPAQSHPANKSHADITAKDAINQGENMAASYLANHVQRWFDRTDITLAIQQDNKPVGGIETIQPIYMNRLHTVFWQGRLSYSNTSTTGNLGLGYRYLTASKKMLWGVNAFFDENIRFLHKRVGLGAELFTRYLTFRANYYNAISRSQYISGNYERALDGFDFSLETPVPYVPWARFAGEGYHWDGVNAKNVNGGSGTLRAYPTKNMELDLGIAHDNSQGNQLFAELNFYFGRPAFIEFSATNSSLGGSIPTRNLEDFRLQKVYRHNEIVVEKTSAGVTGGGIIIARGT